MELFDNLAAVGLTSSVLQIIIIAGAMLFVIGMFWKYIVIGIGIAFCVAVFAMPSKKDVKAVETMTQSAPVPSATKEESVDKTLKPSEEIVKVEPEVKPEPTEKDMFMEDCQKYGGYTPSQCMALWNDRENDQVRYRKATNRMFMLKAKYHYKL